MSTRPRPGTPAAPRRPAAAHGKVTALDAVRIERALAGRARYRYVQPSVRPYAQPSGRTQGRGQGWTIVSPNCSRNIDPEGGDISIAWFEPAPGRGALWRLHRRDHAKACWVVQAEGLTLDQALSQVCGDPLGVWWP